MSITYAIRPAQPPDLPGAAALAAELVRFHHALDPDRFAILSDDLAGGYARYLAGRLRSREAVVLVAAAPDRQIVGYAYGECEGPSWPDLLDAHGRLHDLFVHPDHRGKGLGRELARRAVAELTARGAPRIVLATAAGNVSAQRTFASLGFRSTMVEMTRRTTPDTAPPGDRNMQ